MDYCTNDQAALIELAREEASVVGREPWEQPTIRSSYTVPVFHDGYVYSFSSRFLTCIDADTGNLVETAMTRVAKVTV